MPELLSAWPHHGGRRIDRVWWLSAEVCLAEGASPLRLSGLRWFDTTKPLDGAEKQAAVVQVHEVFTLEAAGADALPEAAEQGDPTAAEQAGGRLLLRTAPRRSDAPTPEQGLAGSLSEALGRKVAARLLGLRG